MKLIPAILFSVELALSTPAIRAQSQAPNPSPPSPNAAIPGGPSSFWDNRGRWTFGAQLAFALENDIPRNISHIAMFIAQPNVGLIVRTFHSPRFPVSRFSLVSEGILGSAVHPGGRLLGQTLLFRFDGKPHGHFVPFFNMGSGILHTTLAAPELSGNLQFMSQAGLGVQYFISPQRAIVFEYRYLHMSNAGIEPPNHGFNASMVSLGFRWLRRPRPVGWKSFHR